MKSYRTQKYRLYPTNIQKQILIQNFENVRLIHNKCLEYSINNLNTNNPSIIKTLISVNQLKHIYNTLDSTDYSTLFNSRKQFLNIISSTKQSEWHNIRFKSRFDNKQSYKTNNKGNTIKIVNNRIFLPKLGWVKISKQSVSQTNLKIISATIIHKYSELFEVNLLCLKSVEKVTKFKNRIVGLDFSLKHLFVSSDGLFVNYPHYFKTSEKKISRQQKILSNCEQGSNNYLKEKTKLAKLYAKVSNQRNDYLHKLSSILTLYYDIICIENIDLADMSKNSSFGKSITDVSWATFVNMLRYKLGDSGKRLIMIDKYFPSTKKCSSCGYVNMNITLAHREFQCICGFRIDRDLNASINIKNEGIRLLKQPWGTRD